MLTTAYADDLRAAGAAAGLDRVGFASADPFDETRVELESRKRAGLHGGMAFTYRNPARSTNPRAAFSEARSLVVAAKSYAATVPASRVGAPVARVARYAVGDHYAQLRLGLDAIAARLAHDGWLARVILDDNALVDRAAAYRAGLGWWGKNSNLLVPGAGSWFVLGSVLTDAPLIPNDHPVRDSCGACTRCLDLCPTRAIVERGVVDARRCLAWLVQAEGTFPPEFRVALGDRIYGCDDCQEVCPPNRHAMQHGALPGKDLDATEFSDAWISVLDLLDASDDELLERHGRWYIPNRDPRYLRRNALVVLGNVATIPASRAVVATLKRYLEGDDRLLQGHAVWAARRLGRTDLCAHLIDATDVTLQSELTAPVDSRDASLPPPVRIVDAAKSIAVQLGAPRPQ